MRKSQKGFTLIELLVVIAIIGILSSVVLASLNSARQRARDGKRVADIGSIRLALETYFTDNGEYPLALDDLVTAGFLPVVPSGPLSGETYFYVPYTNSDPASATTGQDCDSAGETCLSYHLGASLEGDNPALDSDRSIVPTVPSGGAIQGDNADGCATSGEEDRLCYDITS